jgi:hypothetical protein
MTKNLTKFTAEKSKTTIYLPLGLHKGRPSYGTEEAFSSQKRKSSTSKHEIF